MSFQFGAGTNQPTTQNRPNFPFAQQQQQQQQNQSLPFGANTSSTGFGFLSTPTTNATTGFSFASQPATGNSGFTFGAASANSRFSFGPVAPTTTAFSHVTATTTNSGFKFGATTTTVNTKFSFGTPMTTTASGFGFGAPATTKASPAFSFGANVPQTGGLSFGTPAPTPVQSSGTGFSFGTPAPTTASFPLTTTFGNPPVATAPSSGFGFGIPATTTASGFTFGNAPSNSTFTGFAMPSNTTASAFGTVAPNVVASSTGFSLGTVSTTSTAPTGFGFGIGTSTTTAAPTGFTFGNSTTTTPSAFNIGSIVTSTVAPTGFNLNRPSNASAADLNAGSVPATTTAGFTLGTSNSSAPSVFSTTQSATGFQFGTPVVTSTGVPPFSTSGLSFGMPKPTSENSGVQFQMPTSVTSTSSGINLTSAATSTATSSTFPSVTTTTSSAAPAFSFIPNLPAATSSSAVTTSGFAFQGLKSSSSTTTTAAPLMFGSATLSTASSVSSAITSAVLSTTTTVTPSTASPATINFRQLEDNINKWKIELEEQEKVFLNQATQVNAWDRLLIANGEKITVLNDAVERVKLDQQRLDLELDFILAQQSELEDLLTPLEKSIESTPNIHVQQHADLEREHTYHLAESIDAQLKRMSEDIREIIEHVNTANKSQDDNDPVQQVAKILNAHMDALQWVDQNTVALQRRLEGVSKLYETQKRENEKIFHGQY